ncbi:AraC family transcriptional regulator [Paenibacillus macquariensis]|uniref:AraC-like ligand binding domain-containing protein n=1 Tax=Paenibacillus macquariensis TaxID=948756 RepID=A0ABY1K1X2_9BACL|nr:AraC family transcriptional regulator [Paenibacillus macquariensis]MEC0091696.1 AraC family transcriptional regulator [Paenibacillus macquariensis]OAB32377.1 AraC family transcriptional regulator [Paenibacillus macquariensis subsp. macquariensis]SIR13846.1 AraC-like ligand binding domain-containing protein [Paenibacillus macquariensis]
MTFNSTYSVAANPVHHDGNSLHVLFAGESQTSPLHALGPKIYDYYLLHFIEKGTGTFRTEHHIYELGEGSCFLIHPGQLVSYVSDAEHPWCYRWVAFIGHDAKDKVAEAGFVANHSVFTSIKEHPHIPSAISRMQEVFYTKKESAYMASLGYLYLILAEAQDVLSSESRLTGTESQVQRTVKQMILYMSTQFAHPVSIEQMCDSLGYNRAYLSRIFKKETGLSPITYLLKLRIDKSRQLLRERPELSIEQIASSVGITDALYFSRQFRRFCNLSPSAYRNRIGRKPGGSSQP